MSLPRATQKIVDALAPLSFADPVAYVYNPLEYAAAPHSAYLARYARRRIAIIMLLLMMMQPPEQQNRGKSRQSPGKIPAK